MAEYRKTGVKVSIGASHCAMGEQGTESVHTVFWEPTQNRTKKMIKENYLRNAPIIKENTPKHPKRTAVF